ncbi:MAG: hypothetical protein KF713_08715 [Turneriella sp.]|nr:hypothetical protein [Turneriella sp.]
MYQRFVAILTPARAAVVSFIIVCLAHAILIYIAGVDVPMWDSWDAEADWYARILSGNTNWQALVSPHNEHRILFTRIFNGMIFTALGGWHPLVVMYAQILPISACVAVIMHALFSFAGAWRMWAGGFTLLAFTLPFSWGNILSCFQNQFYFMLLFGIVALRCAALGRSPIAYVTAVLLALVSPFTMAGGIGTIITVFILLLVRSWQAPTHRFFLLSLLVILVLGGGAHWFHMVHVPGHDALRAQDKIELMVSILRIVSWPQVPIGIILWGVCFWGLIRNVRMAVTLGHWLRTLNGQQLFLGGMAGWWFLQAIATAATRTHADLMTSRYQQTFALAIPLFFLFFQLFDFPSYSRRLALAMSLILLLGLTVRMVKEWPHFKKSVNEARYARTAIIEAYKNQDFVTLKSKEKDGALGYFNADRIWARVQEPLLRGRHLWLNEVNKK